MPRRGSCISLSDWRMLRIGATIAQRYYLCMTIASFRCRDTQALFQGRRVARFRHIETVALRKLAMLHRVLHVDELRVPPSNRVEQLKGSRSGQWSIRINDQWRLCFHFVDGQALDVEIVDYH